MSTKKVLMIIATGSETVEIVAPADILRGCGVCKRNKVLILSNNIKFNSIL